MKTALLIALQLAASGSDAYFTHRNAARPHFCETNPIARPFMKSTPAMVAFFGAGAAVNIAIPHLLRRHHHEALARTAALAGIADNTQAAIYSALH